MKTISCTKCGKKKEVSSKSRSSYICEECFEIKTLELTCKKCGKNFKTRHHKTYQLYCSRSCKSKSLSSDSKRAISEKMHILHSGKGNPMYGKSPSHTKRILFESVKGGKMILKSSYEMRAALLFDKNENILSYNYEPFYIPYIDKEGTERTYTPDFLLNTLKGNIVAEVKPKSMISLWNNVEKIYTLKKFCSENNLEYIILTEDMEEQMKKKFDAM